MGFSRQECWSRVLCPPPGDFSNPGIKPTSSVSLALQMDSLPPVPPGKPINMYTYIYDFFSEITWCIWCFLVDVDWFLHLPVCNKDIHIYVWTAKKKFQLLLTTTSTKNNTEDDETMVFSHWENIINILKPCIAFLYIDISQMLKEETCLCAMIWVSYSVLEGIISFKDRLLN